MRNTTNSSFWQLETPIKINITKHLAQSEPYGVIIVGAGLMGLWLAYWLKYKYKKLTILIVEKDSGPNGASIRNAGFTCFGSVTELLANAQSMEMSKLLSIVDLRIKGISQIRRVLGEDRIGFNPCGGYECIIGDPTLIFDQISMLNKQLRIITDTNSTFRVCKKSEIKNFGFKGFTGMIHNKLEGSLDSGLLMKNLVKKVISLGVSICPYFEVKGFEEGMDTVRVQSTQNASFVGKQVFICTNGFSKDLLPNENPIIPGRGQVIITSVIPGLPINGTFHFNEGFNYFRNYNGRLLFGGGRNLAIKEETTTVMETSPCIQNHLEELLKNNILPGRTDYTIERRWAGIMGFTNSHQPLSEVLTGYKKVYLVCACNGMGVSTIPQFTHNLVEKSNLSA